MNVGYPFSTNIAGVMPVLTDVVTTFALYPSATMPKPFPLLDPSMLMKIHSRHEHCLVIQLISKSEPWLKQ